MQWYSREAIRPCGPGAEREEPPTGSRHTFAPQQAPTQTFNVTGDVTLPLLA